MNERVKAKVIFRKDVSDKFYGEIIAFFPESILDKKYISMIDYYTYIGQHGVASLDYYYESTRTATEEEYKDLKEHMENVVGYDIEVRKRIQYK